MYYRYEALAPNGEYKGIFSFFNPSQRRYFNRFVREPKWYKNNADANSRCWFTEKGYEKYHHIIDTLIGECRNLKVRIISQEVLCTIAVSGKIQRV
jgi:hypothetical protein